jgi:hypothetical protein
MSSIIDNKVICKLKLGYVRVCQGMLRYSAGAVLIAYVNRLEKLLEISIDTDML